MSQQESDVISFSDLIVTIINNIKIWTILVVLGVMLSFTYGFIHRDKYEYSAYISVPYYVSDGKFRSVIDISKLSRLIDTYYKQYRNGDLSSYTPLRTQLQFDSDKMQLSIKAPKNEMQNVEKLFSQFLSVVQKQGQYIGSIKVWQENIEFNLKELEKKNRTYSNTVRRFQHNMNQHNTDLKSTGTTNGYALLNNISNSILFYQSQMKKNDTEILKYKSELQKLSRNLEIDAGITRSYGPVQATRAIIIILGIVLSLTFATIAVFFVKSIRNLLQEVKSKLKNKICEE